MKNVIFEKRRYRSKRPGVEGSEVPMVLVVLKDSNGRGGAVTWKFERCKG